MTTPREETWYVVTYEHFDCGPGGEYTDRTDESRWRSHQSGPSRSREAVEIGWFGPLLMTDPDFRDIRLWVNTSSWEEIRVG